MQSSKTAPRYHFRFVVPLLAMLITLGLAACGDATEPGEAGGEEGPTAEATSQGAPSAPATVVDFATSERRFSTLSTALDSAGLAETLQDQTTTFTLFAPTDAAFDKLPEGTLDDLLSAQDDSELRALLLNHVVQGQKITSQDIVTGTGTFTTAQGKKLQVSTSDGTIMVGDARIIEADIQTGNGVIHVVDTVLRPSQD